MSQAPTLWESASLGSEVEILANTWAKESIMEIKAMGEHRNSEPYFTVVYRLRGKEMGGKG